MTLRQTSEGHIRVVVNGLTRNPPSQGAKRDEANERWEIEANVLDTIATIAHPHLVQPIASITCGRRSYFIFEWADGVNLQDFWCRYTRSYLPQVTTGGS